jgi:TonB family protein
MIAPLWLQNLFGYCLQVALLAAAGILLPRALRLRAPRVLYRYWQAVLAVCLFLPLLQPWRPVGVEGSATAAGHILAAVNTTAPGQAILPASRLILFVLAGGVVIRLMGLVLGLVRLRRYREKAERIECLPPGVREIATRLGVAPDFRQSPEVPGPVTFGFRRPVVVLPPCFAEMDAARQLAVASHELLHIVRRDWAWNLVEELVLAAFWFHPAIWWLVGQIRLSREQVVDRQVVELTGARRPYLYALVEIAAGPRALRGLVASAFLKESQLAERIRTLIKEDFMSKPRIIIALVCAVVLTLLAGIAVIRRFPLKSGGAPTVASNTTQLPAEIFAVGNGVTSPVPIYKPDPPYTDEARAAKRQGVVTLAAVVGPNGAVTDVKVLSSLDPGLDLNAVNTIRTWTFKPALKDGKPVACKVSVEVSFKMF